MQCARRYHLLYLEPVQFLVTLLQLVELKDVENQLYNELSKTPKQCEAFADVIKTVLDRETAFAKWKMEGATAFWDKEAAAPKVATSCKLVGLGSSSAQCKSLSCVHQGMHTLGHTIL